MGAAAASFSRVLGFRFRTHPFPLSHLPSSEGLRGETGLEGLVGLQEPWQLRRLSQDGLGHADLLLST